MQKTQVLFLGPNDYEYYSEMPSAPRLGELVELPTGRFKCVSILWKETNNIWLLVITVEEA